MISSSLVLLLAQTSAQYPFEPYYFGYMDQQAEIDIRPQYKSLCKSKPFGQLANDEAKAIWRSNPISPYAWKLLIDTYLKNGAGPELLRFISDTSITPTSYDFDYCKKYAVRVILEKSGYSPDLYGGLTRDQILQRYSRIQQIEKWIPNNYSSNLDVWLAEYGDGQGTGRDSSRQTFRVMKDLYPNNYAVRYFYTRQLLNSAGRFGLNGQLIVRMPSEPEKHMEEAKAMREKWPNEEGPCYLLMRHYETRDPKLAKVYAKKFLAIAKKTFRTSWIENAKKVLAK